MTQRTDDPALPTTGEAGDPHEPAQEGSGRAEPAAGGERLAYRFLTGPDTREFCRKVSAALADGYVLYGPPVLCFDDEKAYCGQAVILRDVMPDAAPGSAASAAPSRGRAAAKAKKAPAAKAKRGASRARSKPAPARKAGKRKR